MKISKLLPSFLRASAAKPAGGDRFDFTAPVELTAAAEGDDANKRPTFTIQAYNGGPMNTGYSYYPVVLELSGLKASRAKLPILMNHDDNRPIGQADAITIDAKGVTLSGTITGDDADAQKITSHAKNGFEWQASIGAIVQRREFLDAGKTATVNGRKVTGPLIIARSATLVETSFVTIGADQTTSAKVAAKSPGDTDMKFAEWLKAKGIETFDTLDQPIKDQLQAAFNAEQAAEKPAEGNAATVTAAAGSPVLPDVEKLVANAVSTALTAAQKQWQDDQDHRMAISSITARHPELQAKAIAEKWSKEKAELEVIRASRPNVAPYVNTGAGTGDINQTEVLTAALCTAGNLATVEKQFDDKTLQAAHTRYRGRVGLQQILLEAAWAGGYHGHHFDSSAGGIKEILQAAFSSLSLPGILSNTANKFLLQGFMGVEQTWRTISAIGSVNNFKQITSYRVTGDHEFEEIAKDGQIKHGTQGEESFTNQARTYAKMAAITRQDIINDDLGALTATPQRIGRGGGLKLNSVFWTAFMANTSFFTTGNSNYAEGSNTALGIDALTSAELLFLNQTDPDGKPLSIMPTTLLVPNALNVTASNLMRSLEVRDTTASTKAPTSNPHAGKFDVQRSSYLSNSTITGNSAKAWYLLGSPNDIPVIETVFLNGVQQPTIETADADFNTLGIQMRGFWDFGVNKQDERGGVKMKGEA